MLFLKDFWYGNISPGEGRYHTKEEYKKVYRLLESVEEQLKERLSPEEWALFTQYQDAEGKAGDIEDTDIFIEGFRMGAMMILDVLEGSA